MMYRPNTKDEEQLIVSVAHHWNLPLNEWCSLGNQVYQLATEKGDFVLKSTSFPQAEFAYIQKALAHLWKQGFYQIAPPLPAQDGSFTLSWEGKKYSLSRFLLGQHSNYHCDRDVVLLGDALGRLHLASRGFCCDCYPERLKWGRTIDLFYQKTREMEAFAQQATCYQPIGLPELLYPQGLSYALEEAKKALALLEPYYQKVDAQARLEAGFCHHDLVSGNVLITPEGTVNFIDFDYCISDFRGHDLANLLTKLMKHNHWQTTLAKEALEAYEGVYSLSFPQRMVVLAIMRFPQVFWQAGLARYKEGWVPEEKISRRLRLWRQETELRRQALDEMAYFLKGGE